MKKHITFGNNLKRYRYRLGLTQKDLAEQIGYTEKSISKWETDNGLPSTELLLKLADFFGVSLDALMFEATNCIYFLGIDGGGTKTVFKLTDESGMVLKETVKGASNPVDIGMPKTMALLEEGIREVCNSIPYSQICMFAGLAGGGMASNNNKILNQFFSKFGFLAFENGGDIQNLAALSPHRKNILTIMGTGFIVYALDGEENHRISGWGQLFDEGGSGYTIGRDAIIATLNAADGSGESTLLSQLFEKELGQPAEEHLTNFYQEGKRYIAKFSDMVFEAAKQGDAVAKMILENNMKFVAEKLRVALKKFDNSSEPIPILFSGGISNESQTLFPLIEKHISGGNYQLIHLREEPVDGALKQAKQIFISKMGGNS